MLYTPPGADQTLLNRVHTTASRQQQRTSRWPLRIRVHGLTWHLVATDTYRTSAAGRDLEACFTHGRDAITQGAAASVQIELAQLLIVQPTKPSTREATASTAPAIAGESTHQPCQIPHPDLANRQQSGPTGPELPNNLSLRISRKRTGP